MGEEYAELRAVLEGAGFYTTFEPISRPGDRMVCASRRFRCSSPSGWCLGGNSFWVARRGDDWFIATALPMIYRVQDPTRLAELCLRLLQRQPGCAYADFDEVVRAEFGLIETPEDQFPD